MNLTSFRWQQLYRSDPREWSHAMLEPCTLDELEALCRLLGVPYSGTKAERISRSLDMAALRGELATWGEYEGSKDRAHAIADEVARRYTRSQLVALAKRAGIFYGVNKRGLAIGLLRWRDNCRRRGAEFLRDLRSTAVRQLSMPLD